LEGALADPQASGRDAGVGDGELHLENDVIPVSDVEARQPGPDPERTSYGTFCWFTDPDGNTWLVQEITTRLPGRV
jgi:hypothetical protein